MVEEYQFNKTRRTFMKGAAATGVAATGITAFSSSAAAQPNVTVTDEDPGTGEDSIEEVRDSNIDILRGNRNAQIQNLNVVITEVNEEARTASGTVSGSVLPNPNANPRSARDFVSDFTDAPIDVDNGNDVNNGNDVDNDNGNGISELIRLEIPNLFLDVLGLQIHLDLFLLVTADPEGGLLGQLLAGLGREV